MDENIREFKTGINGKERMKTKSQIINEINAYAIRINDPLSPLHFYFDSGRISALLWVLENAVDWKDVEQINQKILKNPYGN